MAKAIWNNEVIAESDVFEVVEGNIYFPPQSVKPEYLKPSSSSTHCPWKGDAQYYNVDVDGEINADAAWYYPEPYEKAAHIQNHVAFWKGVVVEQ